MASNHWFKDGLRFTCSECGDCCTGAPGFVWVNKQEIGQMAQLVGLEIEEFERRYVRLVGIRKSLVEYSNGDCVFLDPKSRKCNVYDARPRQCRTWPFWDSNVRTEQAWEETCQVCPGSGQGKFHTVDEIVERLKIIRV